MPNKNKNTQNPTDKVLSALSAEQRETLKNLVGKIRGCAMRAYKNGRRPELKLEVITDVTDDGLVELARIFINAPVVTQDGVELNVWDASHGVKNVALPCSAFISDDQSGKIRAQLSSRSKPSFWDEQTETWVPDSSDKDTSEVELVLDHDVQVSGLIGNLRRRRDKNNKGDLEVKTRIGQVSYVPTVIRTTVYVLKTGKITLRKPARTAIVSYCPATGDHQML